MNFSDRYPLDPPEVSPFPCALRHQSLKSFNRPQVCCKEPLTLQEANSGWHIMAYAMQVMFVPPSPVHPHIYSNGHICLDILYDGEQ